MRLGSDLKLSASSGVGGLGPRVGTHGNVVPMLAIPFPDLEKRFLCGNAGFQTGNIVLSTGTSPVTVLGWVTTFGQVNCLIT